MLSYIITASIDTFGNLVVCEQLCCNKGFEQAPALVKSHFSKTTKNCFQIIIYDKT